MANYLTSLPGDLTSVICKMTNKIETIVEIKPNENELGFILSIKKLLNGEIISLIEIMFHLQIEKYNMDAIILSFSQKKDFTYIFISVFSHIEFSSYNETYLIKQYSIENYRVLSRIYLDRDTMRLILEKLKEYKTSNS